MAALGGEGRGSSPEQGAGEERGAPAARGRRQRWEGGCTRSCVKRRLGSAAARPWPALRGGDRRGGGGAALQRRRDLRTKAIQASEVWLGIGLSFPEAAPKQLPRAETQTFYCHSESRGRRLRPARPGPARQSVGPRGATRAPPCSRSPQLQRRGPGPDARASSPELKAKLGRGAGRAASVRPRRPQCAQPRRGRR